MTGAEPTRRLSALIVNHNSGAWTLRCVESLQHAWRHEGRAAQDLEIIVLDSGSSVAEATWWRSLRRAGARVKQSPANVGYATGLNMALELSSGGEDDVVALLNPDLHFLPGSIGPLLERLAQDAKLGVVAPRIYLDEAQQVLLPPNELPSPGFELAELLAARFPAFARRRAAKRLKSAARFWGTQEAQDCTMLSGACMFLRRSTLTSMGEAMDGGFPLYFEDADLCKRLRRAGLSLELEPRAEILHHWSRCAGPEFAGEVARRHAHGRALYMAKHHSSWWPSLVRRVTETLTRVWRGRSARPMHELTDLGSLSESPVIDFSSEGDYLLELSLTPFWGLCAATWVSGERYSYPARTWSWLFPGTYYLRAVNPTSGALLGAWTFEKNSPARSWPLEAPREDHPFGARHAAPIRGERVG